MEILKSNYEKFKENLFEIVKEREFKIVLEELLKYYHSITDEISNNTFENENLKIKINNGKVRYEEKNLITKRIEIGEYYFEGENLVTRRIRKEKFIDEETQFYRKMKYDENLNLIYIIEVTDHKDYSINEEGLKILDNNISKSINYFLVEEKQKISENNWLKKEINLYYADNMKDNNYAEYRIIDRDGYCIISREEYEEYLNRKIEDKELSKNKNYIRRGSFID